MPQDFTLSSGSSIMLDFIRSVTAQLVVLGHGMSIFGIFYIFHQPNFPWIQNIAVLIFFILSGFLISYSTFRKIKFKANYSFKHFFIDRFSRIYSAFIPALLLVVVLDYVSIYLSPVKLETSHYQFLDNYNIKTFIGNLFMFQDFPIQKIIPVSKITSFGSARPFWTLAVEWWIYLFFGYFTLEIIRNKITLKNIIVLAFLSVIPLFNLISGRGDGLFVYWLFGAIIYLILKNNLLDKLSKRKKLGIFLIISILSIIRVFKTMEEYEPIFAFLLSFALLLIIDISKNISFSKIVTNIIKKSADYSYTLYLIHYSILDFLFTHFYNLYNPYLLFLAGFIISNIISIILGYYSEGILTYKLKNKLYSRLKSV